ncbi:hypothetical protein EVAR_9156_1 [Eumeta japonica]|uniref:Uncharacterized protein n=1 Tax=Eumeta variegata TaxID=151549 RepID=A0A4C1TWE9_EUMVA|nr:hypothetical protein EVAR_9156_1 [Eumeta japonica]
MVAPHVINRDWIRWKVWHFQFYKLPSCTRPFPRFDSDERPIDWVLNLKQIIPLVQYIVGHVKLRSFIDSGRLDSPKRSEPACTAESQ